MERGPIWARRLPRGPARKGSAGSGRRSSGSGGVASIASRRPPSGLVYAAHRRPHPSQTSSDVAVAPQPGADGASLVGSRYLRRLEAREASATLLRTHLQRGCRHGGPRDLRRPPIAAATNRVLIAQHGGDESNGRRGPYHPPLPSPPLRPFGWAPRPRGGPWRLWTESRADAGAFCDCRSFANKAFLCESVSCPLRAPRSQQNSKSTLSRL